MRLAEVMEHLSNFAAIADQVGPIIKDVARAISFGVGRTNEERVEHELWRYVSSGLHGVGLFCERSERHQ